MIRRLLARVVPDAALSGVGFVAYRIRDEWRDPHALTASGGICLPAAIAEPIARQSRWQPWPSHSDLLPVFTVPRGGITYR